MSDQDTTRIISRKTTPVNDELTKTVPIQGLNAAQPKWEDDPHTRIFRPKSSVSQSSVAPGQSEKAGTFDLEPVVGWLVVTNGPGRGQALKLGYGMNSIGRGEKERIALTFGDEEISRQGHAMLTYDPKGRKFYIQHGGGTNLTYLNDIPVLQPHILTGHEVIGIGNTKLCFVPFCGEQFDWQDQ
jgi:hypothetical protein